MVRSKVAHGHESGNHFIHQITWDYFAPDGIVMQGKCYGAMSELREGQVRPHSFPFGVVFQLDPPIFPHIFFLHQNISFFSSQIDLRLALETLFNFCDVATV